jgi:predicted  nucleic acid-binding Zn-ribbon protein
MATNGDIDSVIENLQNALEKAQTNKRNFNVGINTKLNSIHTQLDRLYDKIQMKLSKLNELKQKTSSNDAAISQHTENISGLEKQLADAKGEKDALTDQLNAAKEELDRKETQIKGLEEAQRGDSAKLAAQIDDLTKDIQEKQENINALKEETRQTKEELESNKAKVQELTETNAALKEKLGRGIQAIMSAVETLENLSQEDSNSDATIEQINASIAKISDLLSGENDEGPGPGSEPGPFSDTSTSQEPSSPSSEEGPFSSSNPAPTRGRIRGKPVPLDQLGVNYSTRGGKTHRKRKGKKTHRRRRSHRGGYTYRSHSKRRSLTTPRSSRKSRKYSR